MTTAFDIVPYGKNTFFVRGELDMSTAPLLDIALEPVVATGGPILIDISAVSFIDSSALHLLMLAASGLRSGCIALHGANPWARRMFDLVRLDLVDNIHIIECGISPYPTNGADPKGHDLTLRFDVMRWEHARLQAKTSAFNARAAAACESASRTQVTSRHLRIAA